jgi:hypothetical protein
MRVTLTVYYRHNVARASWARDYGRQNAGAALDRVSPGRAPERDADYQR